MNWKYTNNTRLVVQRIDPLNGWTVSMLVSTPEIQEYIKNGGIIDDPDPPPIIIPPTTDQKLARIGVTKEELKTYLGIR